MGGCGGCTGCGTLSEDEKKERMKAEGKLDEDEE